MLFRSKNHLEEQEAVILRKTVQDLTNLLAKAKLFLANALQNHLAKNHLDLIETTMQKPLAKNHSDQKQALVLKKKNKVRTNHLEKIKA